MLHQNYVQIVMSSMNREFEITFWTKVSCESRIFGMRLDLVCELFALCFQDSGPEPLDCLSQVFEAENFFDAHDRVIRQTRFVDGTSENLALLQSAFVVLPTKINVTKPNLKGIK